MMLKGWGIRLATFVAGSLFFTFSMANDASDCSLLTPCNSSPASSKPVPGANQKQPVCLKVRGEASASLGDEAYVRQMAIRDALKTASMQRNVHVYSKQKVDNYQLTHDQSHFTTQSRIQNFEILQEGYRPLTDAEKYDENGILKKGVKPSVYQVILKVCLTEEGVGCKNLPINPYQVRLAIAQPIVMHPGQARDLSQLVLGFQSELVRRLRQQGYQNILALRNAPGFSRLTLIEPNLDYDQLEALQAKAGAQFLLLPVIREVGYEKDSNGVTSAVRHFYLYDDEPNKRYLEVEYFLVDLFDQSIVSQERKGYNIEGDVLVGREKPFGTNAFFETDTGKVFHQLLNEEVQQLLTSLKCERLKARIVEQQGNLYMVQIDQSTGVKVGDQLAVYHLPNRPVRFQNKTLGYDGLPAGFLIVKRVQQHFIVAELVGKKQPIAIGDLVQAW